MKVSDQLSNQHFKEYESRLRHIDELLFRVDQNLNKPPEFDGELSKIREERLQLQNHMEQLRRDNQEKWQFDSIDQAGPMIIWDAVAKKLEELVERIEK